ncbi:MAG: UvrD-helicase domain-containing protein [Planctomycetes bacterium]|nr:UvrD-helicase domain-containing protein [Planctomycetota bacterium]
MTEIADLAARTEALTNFDDNLVLVAGAGSGKTSLLVSRTLCAWLGKRIDPGCMLITTFTEKAASEMAERLDDALRELTESVIEPASDAGRAYVALTREFGLDDTAVRNRAAEAAKQEPPSVLTFHAFCLRWLQEFARTAGLPPEIEILDDDSVHLAFDEFWPTFVEAELGPERKPQRIGNQETRETWRTLLRSLDVAEITNVARSACLEPQIRTHSIDWSRRELVEVTSALFAHLDADPVKHASKLNFGSWSTATCTVVSELLALEESAPVPDALASRASELSNNRATPAKSDYDDPVELARIAETAKRMKACLATWADLPDPDVAKAISTFVKRVTTAFELHLTRLGGLSFSECLVRCARLLGDSTHVRDRLRTRYSLLLVDEFQDTDPLQYDMLFYLAQSGPSRRNEDPSSVDLRPGALCIVGDPKQSIYRFRGADMRAYGRALENILDQGGKLLDLTANFRSEPEILSFVNRAVTPLFDNNPGYQADRQDLVTPKQATGRGSVTLLHVADDDKNTRHASEAAEIARRLLENRSRHRRAWRDYALLFRATTKIETYANALRDAGIPVLVEGTTRFYQRREVERFLALLRLALTPWDETAMLAYLRGPLAAIPESELFAVAEASRADLDLRVPRPTRWLLEEYEDERLAPNLTRAVRALRTMIAHIATLETDAIFEYALHGTGLATLEAAGYEGEQRLANLEILAQRAAAWAREGSHDFEQALRYFEREAMGEKDAEENPLADDRLDAVRLLTIHKAKGLEWDVVVVPDASRSQNTQNKRGRTFVLDNRSTTPSILARLPSTCSPSIAFHDVDERLHDDAETQRLFYVATTRARRELLITWSTNSRNRMWKRIFEGLAIDPCEQFEEDRTIAGVATHLCIRSSDNKTMRAPTVTDTGSLETIVSTRARSEYVASLDGRMRPGLEAPSSTKELQRVGSAPAPSPFGAPGRSASVVGTVVHEYLHGADFESDTVDVRRADGILASHVDATLLQASVLEELRSDIHCILECFVASELRMRASAARGVWREVPVLFRDAQAAWRGSIDLVLAIDCGSSGKNDEIVVVDYKSDRVAEGAEQDFVTRHAPQIDRYAHALQAAWSLAVAPRRELWMLRRGTIHVVEDR